MKSLKSSRGGSRPGAGRKKGSLWPSTIAKNEARELVRQRITAALPEMLDAQIANAQGTKYLVVRNAKTGKFERVSKERMEQLLEADHDDLERIEVWDKDPSVQAFTDLANRALDKPAEQEISVKITGELEIIERLQKARTRLS